MSASYPLLLVLGIAATVAVETSVVRAQTSPSETPAIRKLREDLGLVPPSQNSVPSENRPAAAPAPTLVPAPTASPAPAPVRASLTVDDFKHPVACVGDLFIVAFPGKHELKDFKEEHRREYSCMTSDRTADFGVVVNDAPPGTNYTNIQGAFDMFRDFLLKAPSARLISERNRPQAAHPGRELSLEYSEEGHNVVLTLWFVFAEQRLYVVGVKRTRDLPPAVVAAFLDSFKTAEDVRASKRVKEEFNALFKD